MPTCRSRDDFPGHKFIFVHVPRNAGLSITRALSDHLQLYEEDLSLRQYILDTSYDLVGRYPDVLFSHITISDLRGYYGNQVIDDFYSFAFIRNPWEWLVSMYSFFRQQQPDPESRICGHMTFKQFLRFFVAKRITQHTFFAVAGNPAVGEIFRVEDMPEALRRISAATGLSIADLPIENISAHDEYPIYYDSEDIDLVHAAFADDIARGDYTFARKISIHYARDNRSLRRFIVDGTPRSGTTALMGALSMHPECYCANERFQIFADHDLCLQPEKLYDEDVPPAYPGEVSIIETNIDAYCGRPLHDPSEAYPYLGDPEICARLSSRALRAFGNKTPRYYFNALDICARGTIDSVVIVRNPQDIAASWNTRMANPADAWLSDEPGLMVIIEYLQLCHVLTQAASDRTFVAVYEHLFYGRWRRSLESLLEFLDLPCSDQYMIDFERFFVRQGRRDRRAEPLPGAPYVEGEFYRASSAHSLFQVFEAAGSGRLGGFVEGLRTQMAAVYARLDDIVRLYFEACVALPAPERLLARILTGQSLFFARARFQSLFNPLATHEEWHHLNAWLSVILFYRRAFAAARYFSEAITSSSFSDQVRASFSEVPDRPYIFGELDRRGLSQVFSEGFRSNSLTATLEHAQVLELSGLLEDAQILRDRALKLVRNEAQNRHAACCFAEGEMKVEALIGIGAGSQVSYLSMAGLREGFP